MASALKNPLVLALVTEAMAACAGGGGNPTATRVPATLSAPSTGTLKARWRLVGMLLVPEAPVA